MHFNGQYQTASTKHSELYFFDASKADVQVVSATEVNAYPGTQMHRTMALIKDENFEKAFMLDIMKVKSSTKNDYDFPFYYMGQVINGNFKWDSPSHLVPLGENNGYQHLYLEGKGKPAANNAKFSWLGNGKFYTLTSVANEKDELLLTRLGANDPDFNLRRDAGFMIRRKDTDNTTFVSVIEPHGSYSPVSEASLNSNSHIKNLDIVNDDDDYTAVSITDVKGNKQLFILSNKNALASAKHSLLINNKEYQWTGPYYYK
jgi:hypothetical protein